MHACGSSKSEASGVGAGGLQVWARLMWIVLLYNCFWKNTHCVFVHVFCSWKWFSCCVGDALGCIVVGGGLSTNLKRESCGLLLYFVFVDLLFWKCIYIMWEGTPVLVFFLLRFSWLFSCNLCMSWNSSILKGGCAIMRGCVVCVKTVWVCGALWNGGSSICVSFSLLLRQESIEPTAFV